MYEERTHILVIMRMDLVLMFVYALASFSMNNTSNYFSPKNGIGNSNNSISNHTELESLAANSIPNITHKTYYGYYTCCVILLLAVLKFDTAATTTAYHNA